MDQSQLNWLTNFWNMADDVLRDVYVRGKYRDVVLLMTMLRRLDAVLEPTKQTVLEMKAALNREQVTDQDGALRTASGQAYYNTSLFLLRDLKSRATQRNALFEKAILNPQTLSTALREITGGKA